MHGYPFLSAYSGRLDLTGRVLVGVDQDGTPVCGAPKELARKAVNQVKDLGEALYWVAAEHPETTRLVYAIESAGDETHDKVLPALGTLLNALHPDLEVIVELQGRVVQPHPPRYRDIGERMSRWTEMLDYRPALPPTLVDFSKALLPLQLKWHRALSSKVWSGKLFGTQICTIDDQGRGLLSVGKPGRNSSVARQRFLDAAEVRDSAWAGQDFELTSWQGTLPTIQRFAQAYPGSNDDALAGKILSGEQPVEGPNGPLDPLFKDVPFSFPAVWNLSAKEHRSIDVLMKDGDRPVIVELSEGGEQVRHSIVQAVLYREFVRGATGLHPWFKAQGVDARQCEALVAVPTFAGGRAEKTRELCNEVADLFAIRIVEF